MMHRLTLDAMQAPVHAHIALNGRQTGKRVQSVTVRRHRYCQDLAASKADLSGILAYRAICDRRIYPSGTQILYLLSDRARLGI